MLFQRGFTGVNFFFVLSGFLITTLLLREEDRDGRFSLIGFYYRRALRILPVYFLAVTLSAVLWIGLRGQEQWWDYLAYYYLFLANFMDDDIPLLSHTWSLSVEEQYYIIWPTILLLLTAVKARVAVLVVLIAYMVLAASAVLPVIEMAPPTEVARFLLPVSSYSAILIGSLAAVILHNPRSFAVVWPLLGNRYAPVVLFLVLLVVLQYLPLVLMGWPEFVMHLVMALLLVSVVVREDHVLDKFLRWSPIARIGTISYGLYIWHFYGRHFGNEVADLLGLTGPLHDWVVALVLLVTSIGMAELSFRYFESFFLNLRHRGKKA